VTEAEQPARVRSVEEVVVRLLEDAAELDRFDKALSSAGVEINIPGDPLDHVLDLLGVPLEGSVGMEGLDEGFCRDWLHSMWGDGKLSPEEFIQHVKLDCPNPAAWFRVYEENQKRIEPGDRGDRR